MRKKQRGNGQGSVYKRGSSYTAEVCIYSGGKRTRTRKAGFATKQEAINALPSLRESVLFDRKRISFCMLFDKWTNEQQYINLSKDKKCAYQIAYRKLKPLYVYNDFRQCGYEAMRSCIAGLTYYPARDIKRVLNGMSQLAIKMDCAEKNYAELLELPPIPKAMKSVFTDGQIALIESSDTHIAKLIRLMIDTGLRPVELRTMRISDINWAERYIDCGRKTSVGVPIAIPEHVVPYLEQLCSESSDLICDMSEDEFYSRFYQCLADLCIQDTGVHVLTPVSCRHTFITRLTRRGLPQPIIQKAARHTSYRTTQNYTHLDIHDVLDALNVGNTCG